MLRAPFGENLHFGGLAGIPFTGDTGFKAFAGHIPDNGHVFIVVAPHIGVTPEGELGKYQRPFQKDETTACRACIGAFKMAQAGICVPAVDSWEFQRDVQFRSIQKLVADRFQDMQKHPSGPMAAVAYTVYEETKTRMLDMIDLDMLKGGKLILLGGLQINMPAPLTDFFLRLHFTLYQKGLELQDLLSTLSEEQIDACASLWESRPMHR